MQKTDIVVWINRIILFG